MEFRDPYKVMDLKALRCFWATAKHGSLTQAGVELGISEAAISQRLKSLESYLDSKLYETRGGRFKLTAAGHQTFDLAVLVFDQLQAFESSIHDNDQIANIVLACPESIIRYALPDVMHQFARNHPLCEVKILSRTPKDTIELVKCNEADFGIIPDRILPKGISFLPWRTYAAYLIMPINHPVACGNQSNFQDIVNELKRKKYRFIANELDEHQNQKIAKGMQEAGLDYEVSLEVGSIDTVKLYVARGHGIAIVSGLCLTEIDKHSISAIKIPNGYCSDTLYGVILRDNKCVSRLVKTLLEALGMMPIDEICSR
ncbi:LysR family transcriptional regulator [Amphritea sp. HPY]|uniref:LysR family transcriptional regulator n=1 Tax=Amphritea sp. HPY TaxID=3421652 RepID=UPI003D7E7EDA